MTTFSDYIKDVRSKGRLSFTIEDAIRDLGVSRNAVLCGVYKLKKKGEIISPAKNLYVIIPPEYKMVGCIPAEELIPILMRFWKLNYYVCLLSAAQYYGASHQKPQLFQVMVSKQLKPIICGKIKIEFLFKNSIEKLPTRDLAVKTGYLTISSPELTAMDLLMYSQKSGGLNHIATILSELIEEIDPSKLMEVLEQSKKKSFVQRLGYILENIESIEDKKKNKVVQSLYKYATQHSFTPAALAPELPTKGKPRNHRWMIIENAIIESDL